jgi:spermidine synthase
MVGPLVIHRCTREVARVGLTAGTVFAVSTVGSVGGTLLVGFVLLPSCGTRSVLYVLSAVLATLGVALAWRERDPGRPRGRRRLVAWLVFAVVGVLGAGLTLPDDVGSRPDARFRVLYEDESMYGKVRVVQERDGGRRYLLSDVSAIGAGAEGSSLAVFPYLRLLEALPHFYPAGRSALVIGLGAGYLPRALAAYDITTDTIEIDPGVVRAAQSYFGFQAPGALIVGDARYEVRKLRGQYDFIIHDCFSGGTMPVHLLSVEAMRLVGSRLSRGGIFALNFYGFTDGQEARPLAAVVATIRAVFPHLRMFAPVPEVTPSDTVILASAAPIAVDEASLTGVRSGAVWWALARLDALERPMPRAQGFVITDDFNPLEHLQVEKAERYRRQMRARFGDLLAR